jgi:HEAT repeats
MEISSQRSRLAKPFLKPRIARATAFAGQRGPISWFASALVAAGFAAGSSAFAQYAASGQPYSNPYAPGSTPVLTQSAPSQSADQTDEQLLTIGRLLEQQGRYAQAQRIYTELERRRLSGAQQSATAPTTTYPQQTQYQPPGNYPPQNFNQPPTGMMPQGAAAPIVWQNAPAQMPNQWPMMQYAPQGNVPVYDQSPQVMAVQPPTQLPPPAPPSEPYVVDTEVTPQPKTNGLSDTQGWRSAIAPLPAAFHAWNSDRPTPYQERATNSTAQPSPRNAVAEQTSLPDLPIAPIGPLNSTANQFPSLSPEAATNSQPRFAAPMLTNGERRRPLTPDQLLATPRTLRLAPLPARSLDNLEAERETSQKQTDAIRIIPGQRVPLQLKPEDGTSKIDPRERPPGLGDEKAAVAGDLKPPTANFPPEPSALTRSEQSVNEATPRVSEATPRFDLAAWVSSPEFREIHTADVIAGLDLLTRPEPRYRAAGAMRIAAAGDNARTALPVLRKVLTSESDRMVRLRIAEALLKLQPNDRVATECLADLLSGRNEAQLRQAAAAALGSAAGGRNSIAVASLTDSLDDPSPQVRAASATSLGLFGRGAFDSISRLENTAVSDVPVVRQAATVALASIRGIPADQLPAGTPESAANFKPQTPGPFALETSATGRAKLVDRLPPKPNTDRTSLQQGAAVSQPKLFPADRFNGSRVPSVTREKSDDDAVPASATAAEAPTKPFASQSPVFQPLQFNLAPPQTQSPVGTNSTSSDEPPTFLLQSEAGASKASSKP